jgi:hypothetical protein
VLAAYDCDWPPGIDRQTGAAWSQVASLVSDGCSEEQLGVAALRDVAARRLAEPRIWWWTYRVHLAVRQARMERVM